MEALNSSHAKKILQSLSFSGSVKRQVNLLLDLLDEDNVIEVSKIHENIFFGNSSQASANTALNRLIREINDNAKKANINFKACITADKKVGAGRKVWFEGSLPLPNKAIVSELNGIPFEKVIKDQKGILQDSLPIILILTFNKHETAAIHELFPYKESITVSDIICFKLGVHDEKEIIQCVSHQGAGEAQNVCSILIKNLLPRLEAIIGAGIAYGINEKTQKIGDVLVSSDVQDCNQFRCEPSGAKTLRGDRPTASKKLLLRFKTIQHTDKSILPPIHFGTILSGSQLIDNRKYRDTLKKLVPTAIGGEMEGIGISTAASTEKIDWIIVKGICDFADGNKSNPGKEDHQKIAAQNAAKVLHAALTLCNLYPQSDFVPPDYKGSSQELSNKKHVEFPPPRFHRDAALDNVIDLSGKATSMDKEDTSSHGEKVNALDTIVQWAKSKDAPYFFALLGEYGMGKTVTCQLLTEKLRKLRQDDPAMPLPLLFDLRHVTGLEKGVPMLPETLEECMERGWINQDGANKYTLESLQKLLDDERAVVIFDGLDEVLVKLDASGGQIFTANLMKLHTDVTERRKEQGKGLPPLKVLFSCRTQFFRTLRDQKNYFTGQERGEHGAQAFKAMTLLPLNEDQVRLYLDKSLAGANSNQIMRMLKAVHNLEELSRRPYTLKFIRDTLPKIEEMRREGKTIYGVTIYRTMVQQWLERDSGKHHIKPDHKLILAAHLAAHLWKKGDGLLPAKDIEDWFLQWLETQPIIARRCAGITADQLEEDLRTATFLARQDEGQDSFFRFSHTSLQEYFLADYLLQSLKNDIAEDWSMPVPSHETFIFFGQMLAEDKDSATLTLRLQAWGKKNIVNHMILIYTLKAMKQDLPKPNLRTLDFSALNLEDIEFEGKYEQPLDISQCSFAKCNLRRASFKHVLLEQACFRGAKLTQAKFLDCQASEVDWQDIEAHVTTWRRCDLSGGHWTKAFGENPQFISCTNMPNEQSGYKFSQISIAPLPATYESAGLPVLSLDCDWASHADRDWLPDDAHILSWWPFGFEIINASTGLPIRHIETKKSIDCLRYSVDGQHLVTAGPKGLEFWEIATAKKTGEIGQHRGIEDVVFSPDASQCLILQKNKLRVISVDTGAELVSIEHDGTYKYVWWPLDGKYLLARSDKRFTLWQAKNGKEHFTVDLSNYTAFSYSPNGTLFAITDDTKKCEINIWEVNTGNKIHPITTDSDVKRIYFSPDGSQLAIFTANGTLYIHDTRTCQTIFKQNMEMRRSDLEWSVDGRYLHLVSDADKLMTLEVDSGVILKRLQLESGNNYGWSDNQSRIMNSTYLRNMVHDVESGEKLLDIKYRATQYNWAWAPNSNDLLTYTDNSHQVFSMGESKLLHHSVSEKSIQSCVWSKDGAKLLSINADTLIQAFDVHTGDYERSIQISLNEPTAEVLLSPDQKKLLTVALARDTITIWDYTTGEKYHEITVAKEARNIHWSPDSSRIIVSENGRVKIFSANRGESLPSIDLKTDKSLYSYCWSPDSKYIVTVTNIIAVWKSNTGTLLFDADFQDTPFWGAMQKGLWSPDSSRVAIMFKKAAKIFDVANRKELISLELKNVRGCAWSPDGKHLAVTDEHGFQIFDTTSWDMVLQKHSKYFLAQCKWSADGSKICTTNPDHGIQVWDSKSGELLLRYHFVDAETMVIWDVKNNRIVHQQGELWPHFSWRTIDEDGLVTYLPFEALDANAQPTIPSVEA